MAGLLEALLGSPAGSPVRGLMAQYQMLNPGLPPQAVAQQVAPAQQRGAIDTQTQAYIDRYAAQNTPFNAWQDALSVRQQQPNDVALRNAEHYLYSRALAGAPSLLAPGYLAYKIARDRQIPLDPWGELKWGLLPIFRGYGDRSTIPAAVESLRAQFKPEDAR